MTIAELKKIIADLYLLNEQGIAQLKDAALDKILRAIASEKTIDASSVEKIITLISPDNIGLTNHTMAKLAYRTATESLPIAYQRNMELERAGQPINYSFKYSEPLYKTTQYFTEPRSLERLLRVSANDGQPHALYIDDVARVDSIHSGIFCSQDRNKTVASRNIVYFVANLHNFMNQQMELSIKQAFFGALVHPSFHRMRKDGLTYLQVISQLQGFSLEHIRLLNGSYHRYLDKECNSNEGIWHEKLELIFNNFDAFLHQIKNLDYPTLCKLLTAYNYDLQPYIHNYNKLPLSDKLQGVRLANTSYFGSPHQSKEAESISPSFLLQVLAHPATRVTAAIFLIAGIAGLTGGALGLAGTAVHIASSVLTATAYAVTVAGFFAAKSRENHPIPPSNTIATPAP